MSKGKSTAYWMVTGACLGLGLILIFSLGFVLLLAGALLVAYGITRVGTAHLWAALFAMGLAPALLLTYQYLSLPRYAQDDSQLIWNSFPSGYLGVTITFWVIALAGLLWGASRMLVQRRS